MKIFRSNMLCTLLLWAAAYCLLSSRVAVTATLTTREESCQQAVAAVETWLKPNPDRAAWERYLLLDNLRAALEKSNDLDAKQRREKIAATIRRLSAANADLQTIPLADLRAALVRFINDKYRLPDDQLPSIIRSLPPTFRLYSTAEIEQTRKSLQTEMRTLDTFLAATGANGAGWKTFLEWDQWYPRMAKGEQFDTSLLITIYKKLHCRYPGLETPPFAAAVVALDMYLRRLLTANTTETTGSIESHCERLAVQVELFIKEVPADWDTKQAEALAWLDLCGQHPDVTADLRQRLSRSNVVLQLSAGFFQNVLERTIEKNAPVHDVILGAQISGTSQLKSQVNSQFVPNPEQGLLQLTVRGDCISRTTADAGRVDVYSSANTPFVGNATLTFNETGAHLTPFVFKAQTVSTTLGLNVKTGPLLARLVQRMASKQVAQQKAEADAISSRHGESKLSREFSAVAQVDLDKFNHKWWEKIRQPLLAAGQFPDQFRFSTTNDALCVAAREANQFQLGAPTAPPPIEGNPTLSLRIHQSGLNNLFAGIWPGKSVREQDLREKLTQILSEISKTLGGDSLQSPWSGRLAEHQPVQFKFADNGFTITVRNQSLVLGSSEQGAMDLEADYKLHLDGVNLVANRDGVVRFHAPEVAVKAGKVALSPTSQNLLQASLEQMFPKEVILKGPLTLPNGWSKAGPLDLKRYRCDGGWLTLEWEKLERI